MPALWLLLLQFSLALAVFGLIAAWWVWPRLAARDLTAALLPLLAVNAFRFVPMALYAPGQIDAAVPAYAVNAIALGDLVSALLAVAAAVALRYRGPAALALAWVFSIVGAIDVVAAFGAALAARIYAFGLGFSWFVVTLYVPVVLLTQVMIFRLLLRRAPKA